MDYRFARAFLATADTKSFSQAARKLLIAQSAVSRQIKLLEESLGHQLFFRSNKEVRLTDLGERLFARLQEFNKWVEYDYQNAPVELRIAALDGLLDTHVLPKIAASNLSDRIKLRLLTKRHPDIESAITRGEIDIAMTYLPIRVSGYSCRKLFDQTMTLISAVPLKKSDISKERWIHMGRAEFLRKLGRPSKVPDIVVDSLSTIVKLVSFGMGIAAVPKTYVSELKDLYSYDFEETSSIYLICRDYSMPPDDFKKLIKALKTFK